jgi:hypothetical protein
VEIGFVASFNRPARMRPAKIRERYVRLGLALSAQNWFGSRNVAG